MLKLFKITKTQFWYGGNRLEWEKYFIAPDKDIVEKIVRDRFGKIGDRYDWDGESGTNVNIEECEVEMLGCICLKNI